MGIAEAIERVRRHARQTGLGAVVESVGEQLRSNVVPTPLRGAAWRIASILEAACPTTTVSERTRDVLHGDRAALQRAAYKEREQFERARDEAVSRAATSTANEPAVAVAASGSSEIVPNVARADIREVSPTASDSGEAPLVPIEGEAVRPEAVGATPTFNATPVTTDPVDATPVDDAPTDALDGVVLVEPIAASDDRSNGSGPQADDVIEPRDVIAGEALSPESPVADDTAAARDASSDGVVPLERAAANERLAVDDVTVARESRARSHGGDHAPAPESSAGRAAKAAPQQHANKPQKPRSKSGARKSSAPPAATSTPEQKEGVAASDEAAKTLARSNSRGAKKRSRAKADTSKKK